jgi:hypothetical protein
VSLTTSQVQALDARRPSYRYDRNVRANRRTLRATLEDGSRYWSHLAPTVAFVPDFLVVAWAELCNGDDDALGVWVDLLHDWPARPLRYIDHATDLVREYISIATTGGTHLNAEVAS